MLLKMVVRKTKEDGSVRETQPVVLPVKRKESLSYMNSREFTYIYVGDVGTSGLSFGRFPKTWAQGDITGRRT